MVYPILSIITINLNNASGLQHTMDSVLSQTSTDFEYIIIDGASTDDSVQVIQSFTQNDKYINKKISWISEDDNGIYNAMNKGIRMASGEFVLFLNSGDCLININIITNVIRYLKEDYDIVSGIVQFDDGRIMQANDTYSPLLFLKNGFPHPSSFIRKKLFKQYGYYDESYKIISDFIFFYKVIIQHHISFKIIEDKITLFDIKGISATLGELIDSEKKRFYAENLTLLENELISERKEILESNEYKMGNYVLYGKYKSFYKMIFGIINVKKRIFNRNKSR